MDHGPLAGLFSGDQVQAEGLAIRAFSIIGDGGEASWHGTTTRREDLVLNLPRALVVLLGLDCTSEPVDRPNLGLPLGEWTCAGSAVD